MQSEKEITATGTTGEQKEKNFHEQYLADIAAKYRKMKNIELELKADEIAKFLTDLMRILPLALANDEYEIRVEFAPVWLFSDAEDKCIELDIIHQEMYNRFS